MNIYVYPPVGDTFPGLERSRCSPARTPILRFTYVGDVSITLTCDFINQIGSKES